MSVAFERESGNGAASNGTPGNGAANNGAASNGTPGNGAAGNGAAGNGAAGNGAAGNGAAGNALARNGAVLTPDPGADRPGRQYALPHYRPVSEDMAIAPTITVVIPAMNEARNLPDVFATLPDWIDEVVLVDGRSKDDTIAVARRLRPDIKVVHQGGVGKGDALAAGFAAASGEIIVAIDGDGSTDGREIVRFVSTLLAGADFVKGSRFASDGRSDDITAIRRYGNRMLNVLVNKLFGTQYTDLCYGYNAFWARHLHKLALDSPGFEVEALMGIRAAKARLRIHEVPSHERPRQHGTSNLSAIRDGLRILRVIVNEKAKAPRHRGPKPFMAPARIARDSRTQS
jgi:hypothetical protein